MKKQTTYKTEWVISAERQKARNKKLKNREEECL